MEAEQGRHRNPRFQGKHHTKEAKDKIRMSNLGHPVSEETKAKMRVHRAGWKPSEKCVAQAKIVNLGRHLSEEHRAKIGAAQKGEKSHNYGKHPSDETRARIGAAFKGRKRTPEAIEKTRMANLGRKHSPETKVKISKANKGKPCGKRGTEHYLFGKHMPPEHLAKLVASRKANYAKRLEEQKVQMGKPSSGENNSSPVKPLAKEPLSPERRAKISEALRGEKNGFLGKHHTEEAKRKMSEIRKTRYSGVNHPMYGKHHTPEARRNMSLGQKGRKEPWQEAIPKIPKVKEIVRREGESETEFGRRLKLSQFMKGKPSIMKGKHHTPEALAKISQASKTKWADPEYKDRVVKSMIKASNHRPTSAEKALEAILNEVCLNEYKYVGNSNEVVIGGCSPDFVHVDGTKRVMEAHGDFWHSKRRTGRTKEEEEAYKITRYKEFGYECLIIWEHEMKQDKDAVAERIRAFNKGAELEQPQLL